jgi:small subunit ribosomal protein S11
MSSFSMRAMSKALPSVCRQSQPRTSLGITRPFSISSIQQSTWSPRDSKNDIERQILNREPEKSSDRSSPLSAITQMMQGDRPTSRGSTEYSRMAESLESDMIKNPYADRAPPHHLHVYCHKHNTILTLTRPNGNPLMSIGCGQIGFRKAGRSGFDPAYQLSAHVMTQIQEKGHLMEIERLEIVFRGFGKGREAFTKVLLGNEGRFLRGLVVRVTDSTRLKFGGTRSRHERRLG